MYDNVYVSIKRMHAMADGQVSCISCRFAHIAMAEMLPALCNQAGVGRLL